MTHDRRLSLLTPSGGMTLGNYLGALRPMVAGQHDADCFYGIADLHSLTVPHDPATLRDRVRVQATSMLAVGLDQSTLFVQSQVPAHAQLAYLLECVATTGELNRMIQFKEKVAALGPRSRGPNLTGADVSKPTGGSIRASLFTYPALMAADILLYRPATVPVGDDQRQHVELTRDLAIRFNHSYGQVFTVPEVRTPRAGARVMDLIDPTSKMGKSGATESSGVIRLLDPPDVVRRKVARAVTDSDVGPNAVRSDSRTKPGVTNLLEILRACGGVAEDVTTYGALKQAVTDAVVAELEPIQARYRSLAADPTHVTEVYRRGSERARAVTEPVLSAATAAIGL